jgi:hypothetical protein
MRRKNKPVQFTPEKFVYALVVSWATYHSIKALILDL